MWRCSPPQLATHRCQSPCPVTFGNLAAMAGLASTKSSPPDSMVAIAADNPNPLLSITHDGTNRTVSVPVNVPFVCNVVVSRSSSIFPNTETDRSTSSSNTQIVP